MRCIGSEEPVEVVSPPLHHLAALVEIFRAVIRGADGVSLHVGKLTLYHVRGEAVLVQERGGHAAEAVGGHLACAVAHRAHSFVKHDGGEGPAFRRQDKAPDRMTREGSKLGEQRGGLSGEGDNVISLHLHARSGNAPFPLLQVKLCPLS